MKNGKNGSNGKDHKVAYIDGVISDGTFWSTGDWDFTNIDLTNGENYLHGITSQNIQPSTFLNNTTTAVEASFRRDSRRQNFSYKFPIEITLNEFVDLWKKQRNFKTKDLNEFISFYNELFSIGIKKDTSFMSLYNLYYCEIEEEIITIKMPTI